MSKRNNFYGSKSGLTARTLAFLAATGISDTTIANALNTMDLALIANGLDTKMQALYPFVGGTATTHKFNFMNAADTDAAFRLTFTGGWTHSSAGALPNGTTGAANSHYNPLAQGLTVNDIHISFYSRNGGLGGGDISAAALGAGNSLELFLKFSDASTYYGCNDLITNGSHASTDGIGFYCTSRSGGTNKKLYKNGATENSIAFSPSQPSPPNENIYLGVRNLTGVLSLYSQKQCAFATIGTGLSDAQYTNLYNLIQTFQTSLSRQV